jgi:hypothetical protein
MVTDMYQCDREIATDFLNSELAGSSVSTEWLKIRNNFENAWKSARNSDPDGLRM